MSCFLEISQSRILPRFSLNINRLRVVRPRCLLLSGIVGVSHIRTDSLQSHRTAIMPQHRYGHTCTQRGVRTPQNHLNSAWFRMCMWSKGYNCQQKEKLAKQGRGGVDRQKCYNTVLQVGKRCGTRKEQRCWQVDGRQSRRKMLTAGHWTRLFATNMAAWRDAKRRGASHTHSSLTFRHVCLRSL